MKKIVSLILALVIAMSAFSVGTFAVENEVKVTLDGFEIKFDVPGRLIGDRPMVPLRTIFEVLGADVEWVGETREIISTRGKDTIKLAIGSNELYKNGELAYTMDVAPIILEENGESRTLVPARAVSEAFGCTVDWDSETRTAIITDINEDTVMTIAGFPVDYDTYSYFCNMILSSYYNDSSVFDNDPDAVKKFRETVLMYLIHYYAQFDYAADLGLTPYTPEVTAEIESALETYKSHYGDDFDEILAKSSMTENLFAEILKHSAILEMIDSFLHSDFNGMSIEEISEILIEKNLILRAAHILFEDRESAEALLEKAKAATDDEFFALAEEYGTDPGMIGNPNGYYFTPGEMVEEFENAVLASKIGDTTDIVESAYGYHIIRRLPIENKFIIENAEAIIDMYVSYIYSIAINEKIAEVSDEVVFLDKYDEIDILKDFVKPYFENAELSLEEMLSSTFASDSSDNANDQTIGVEDETEAGATADENTPAYDNDKFKLLI